MNRPIWIPHSYPKFGVLRFEAKLENILEYDSGVHMGWFTKKQRAKILCYCPFKILSITKKPGGKKISNSKLLHGQKKCRKLRKWKSQVAGLKLRTLEKIAIAVAEQHFLKSCGIGTAEVFPSSCEIGIAESKKSCACPPLSGIERLWWSFVWFGGPL